MTLQQVIEQAVAETFLAGAEWHALHTGQDSAAVGREARAWQTDNRYQQMVKHHQRKVADAVGRAIMRLTLMPQGKQTPLFRDGE